MPLSLDRGNENCGSTLIYTSATNIAFTFNGVTVPKY